jgi:c-di-GMP-binding flagellar brake protein YcgR
LSAGGLMLALSKAKLEQVKIGDRMHLKSLSGTVQLNFLSDIYIEIRWIKESDSPGYMSVGCELLNLSNSLKEQVIKFVDIERKSRGQYR